MTRKFALTAGILFTALSAGTLTAQTAATTKPSSTSTMQHALPKGQDSTRVHSSSAVKVHHAKWSTDQVKEAQEGLAKAGYYKGQPNGKYDRSTRTAIREYQKANKMKVTGRLNDALLTKLSSTS